MSEGSDQDGRESMLRQSAPRNERPKRAALETRIADETEHSIRSRFLASWQAALEEKLYFPLYPNEAWVLFPDYEAVSEIGRPSPLSGDDSISLFEAAILLGYRLKGSPWALIGKAPIRFAEWFLSGQIDPREPGSLVPFSKLPFIAPVDLQDEPRIPDMTWRLWPRDIDRLALAIWGETIFQEQDGVSDQAPAPTINQAPAPTQKPKRGLNEGTLLRITGALVCALADTDPERLKHEDGKRSIALKKKNGSINLGTAKETGDTGVVGYLTANGYTTLTRSTLEKYLSEASKADP